MLTRSYMSKINLRKLNDKQRNQEFKRLIDSKKKVSFTYGGELRRVRIYVHGKHKESGTEEIRAHQYDGRSNSGLLGWKLFKVEEIYIMDEKQDSARDRADYNKNDKDLEIINQY